MFASLRKLMILTAVVALGLFGLAVSAAQADDKPEFPKFEEVTKGTEVRDGFLKLYHDKEKDRLFARIPGGMLGKPFLMTVSIADGPVFAGWQWMDVPVYFERFDKQLVLMAADPRYKKGNGSTVADVIARTYTDTIITKVAIKTLAGGDPVIDLNDLLKGNLTSMVSPFGGLDGSLSRYSVVKSFPNNTNIAVEGPAGGQMVRIYFSLMRLPEGNGYQPREADSRIGYFMTVLKDWSAPHNAETTFTRYINRWQLRKVDPSAEVSDVKPEDQIVFYIEKTVPVEFRHYVREGILEWNKAFEKAGLRNAIVVYQQTDTNEFADLDPEDARYNFFRWIVSGDAFAMGPSRVNPYTGQILDADIIFDDAFIRNMMMDFDIRGPKAELTHIDPGLDDFLADHPQWDFRVESFLDPAEDTPSPVEQHAEWLAKSPFHHHCETCQIGRGAVRQMATASLWASKGGCGRLPEAFLGQMLKETVTHEVGHTLGLRHNFKASTWRTLDEIRNMPLDTPEATTASVMDYNAFVFAEDPEKQGVFVSRTIGPWDYWVIDYGYRHFTPGKEEGAPKNEQEMLAKIASRCTEPALAYATDEDTSLFQPDPSTNRWDMGKDPIDFAQDNLARARRLWKDGLDWAVNDGDSYSKARRAFGLLLSNYAQGMSFATRIIGGQYIHRDHKGDSPDRLPIEPVSAAEQRRALAFLGDTVLSCKDFEFAPEMLNSLAAGRWGHWGSDSYSRELDYNVHDRVRSVQGMVLFQLMSPPTLNRLWDAQIKYRPDEDIFSVPELFHTLSDSIWTELSDNGLKGTYTTRKPLINSFRRNLQREHLQRLIDLTLAPPGAGIVADVHSVARLSLKDLGGSIQNALEQRGSRMDDYSRAHLIDCQRRIEQAMAAEFVAR
jgi:hypothetical protein